MENAAIDRTLLLEAQALQWPLAVCCGKHRQSEIGLLLYTVATGRFRFSGFLAEDKFNLVTLEVIEKKFL